MWFFDSIEVAIKTSYDIVIGLCSCPAGLTRLRDSDVFETKLSQSVVNPVHRGSRLQLQVQTD